MISPDGNSAVFLYAPDFSFDFNKLPVLMSVDLSTGNFAFLKSGNFREVEFSKDGRFLLYIRDTENDSFSNVYTLDLKTLKEKKIGKAQQAKWIP